MKVKNISNNTIHVQDVDMYIPYSEETIDLEPDLLKKSKNLKAVIIHDYLKIIDYNPEEQIEATIVYLKKKKQQTQNLEEKPEEKPDDEEEKENTPEPEMPVIIEIPQLDKITEPIELKITGLFYDDSGYGKVNRNLAYKLHQAGFKVKINPKSSRNQLSEEELKIIAPLEKTKVSRDHIQIDSIIPSFAEMAGGKYRVLYTTIESYTVPQQFLDCCEMYQEIWLTSPWSATILKNYINKPIYVVPSGVDETLYTEDGPAFNLRPNVKDFVFMSVFSWGYRKGWDVLLKAYFDEFSEEDNVSLLIMSKFQGNISRYHRNKIKEDIESIMKKFPNKDLPHLLRHSQVVAEKDMPKFYRAGNCFVLPSRGEGGGLPPIEASLCGLPVIMTNASGQQMYLRPDNAYLLDIDQLSEVQRGQFHIHYWDGQKFPSLTSSETHKQLKKHMRHVVNNYQEAKQKNKRLQQLILSNFTWTHTANAATKRLKEIAEKMRNKK